MMRHMLIDHLDRRLDFAPVQRSKWSAFLLRRTES